MNIIIDIGHPAHVHLLRNLYSSLRANNHKIIVTVKTNLKSARQLLDYYNIPCITIGNKSDNLFSKALNQIFYAIKIAKIILTNNITLGLGTSMSLSHASMITRMKSIILDDDDDDIQPLFTKFAHPFCNVLLSPEALKGHRKKKDTIYYSGFHELAYLHPNHFTPDNSVLEKIGITNNDPFFILRFNSFKAHHDVGVKGLSLENKRKLIQKLKCYGKIYITTEREIEHEFKQYQLALSPEKIHSLLYYATMFIGDSQTMASEASVLGTPAIRSNSFVGRISYLEEEEHKYGLTYGFRPNEFDGMIRKIDELLAMPNLQQEWQKKRQNMLNDKIDVTAFMVWFVENYPESRKVMHDDPSFQLKFK